MPKAKFGWQRSTGISTRKIRVSVIGAGSWAVSSHIPNLLKYTDVELVGICRKGSAELERLRSRFGFKMASENYLDVIAAGADAFVISSPAAYHHEHGRAALRAGAHVLMEKPFTLNARHGWELVREAQTQGRQIVVAFGWNYRAMAIDAMRLMESPGIGRIESLSIHMASTMRALLAGTRGYVQSADDVPPDSSTWVDPTLSGGGYAHGQLSHALGLALWLTDLRASEVAAFMGTWIREGIEYHDAIAIRFVNDAVGSLFGGSSHLGAGNNKHQLEIRAFGSEGQIHLDLERELVWHWHREHPETRVPLDSGAGDYECSGPIDVLVRISRGEPVANRSPGELGARTVEILEASYRSASTRQIIDVAMAS